MSEQISPLASLVMEYIAKGRNIFITGGGGMGKSHLTRELLRLFESPLPLATTNLAAFHIQGGTIHKAFKLYNCKSIKEVNARDDINISKMTGDGTDELVARNRYFKSVKDDIKAADVIFIDEISMLSAQIFDVFIYRLELFLGHRDIPIVVIGDLFQLPPVKSDNRRADMVFMSKHWDFMVLELTKMKRTTDVKFAKIQNLVRQGKATPSVLDFIKEHSVDEEPSEGIIRLYPTREQVSTHNRKMLRRLKSKEYSFRSEVKNIGNLHKGVIDSFLEDMSAETTLKLKVGAKIIFVASKDGEFFNGETGVVEAISSFGLYIKVKKSNGAIIKVEKALFSKIGYKGKGKKLKANTELEVKQFPIKLSWAITIHKTQGMTITEPLFIDCNRIFEDSQFYVALSRASKPDNVIISGFEKRHIRVRKGIRQFYQEQEDIGNLIKITDY